MTTKSRRRGGALPRLLIAALSLILIALILSRYVFVVRNIQVHGESPISAEDVIRLSGLSTGSSIFRVNAAEISRSVESTGQLRCTDCAVQFPATVRITVQPRSLAALIRNAGTLVGIDEEGIVMGSYTTMPQDNLPFVSGLSEQVFSAGKALSASEETLTALHNILSGLKSVQKSDLVSEINLQQLDDLTLYTRGGMLVLLGDADNMVNKLNWMVSALSDLEEKGVTRGQLDVSSGKMADYRPQ